MKGKIEGTSPQRQFENMKKTYYFSDEKEERNAENAMKVWMLEEHQQLGRMTAKKSVKFSDIDPSSNMIHKGVTEVKNLEGKEYRKRNGIWEVFEKGINKWIESKVD